MVKSLTTAAGLHASLRLDRRAFLGGAGLVAGALALEAWALWPLAGRSACAQTPQACDDWAVDHVFGAYPPYAHPIPPGRPAAVPDAVPVDPQLMI